MGFDGPQRLGSFFSTEAPARAASPTAIDSHEGSSLCHASAIAEYFDHVYCINLARRDDRWAQVGEQFDAVGLEVERSEAIDGCALDALPTTVHLAQSPRAIPGIVGCSLSHRRVLEDARACGYKRFLVLEDDVVFAPDADARFARTVGQVPDDWAMLYLGGNHRGGLSTVTPNIARTRGTYTTNCYAVTAQTAATLLTILPSDPLAVQAPVDVVYFSLHQRLPAYAFRPHLAWQRDGFSDVELADVEYGFLRD